MVRVSSWSHRCRDDSGTLGDVVAAGTVAKFVSHVVDSDGLSAGINVAVGTSSGSIGPKCLRASLAVSSLETVA